MNKLTKNYNSLKNKILMTYFADMNKEQRIAIGEITGSLLILAGAGSGKTTVIVNRIFNMIEYGIDFNYEIPESLTPELLSSIKKSFKNSSEFDFLKYYNILGKKVEPRNIVAITFTNKAAQELKERIVKYAGNRAEEICTGTFHWFCLQILYRHIEELGFLKNFTIYDADDSKKLIKNIMAVQELNEEMYEPKAVIGEISRAKNKLINADDYAKSTDGNFRKSVIAKVYKAYQNELKNNNAVDFDDMIMLTVELFQKKPKILERYQELYKYIMVDEYQDTNYCQFVLIHMLASKYNNICVVGDDDQSIYKFRGANIDNILNFEKYFRNTKTIRLEQNYRSTKTILNAANAVIANNKSRKGKKLWTDNKSGKKIKLFKAENEYKEALYIAENIEKIVAEGGKYNDCAVFYRTNAQSNVIENVLVRKNIAYHIFGGLKFYDRKEIKDVLAYLNVIANKKDEVRILRIINEPKRGIGSSTVQSLKEIAQLTNKTLFEVMENVDKYENIKKAKNIKDFVELINNLESELMSSKLQEIDIIERVIEETGYKAMLVSLGFEGENRLENIKELKSNLMAYISDTAAEPTLDGFLKEISLYTNEDEGNTEKTDKVSLMTLHAAKGLEFENVFIVGMEEGIFPSGMALIEEHGIEEERRLAYVGFTRAKKQLFLLSAEVRTYLGRTSFNKTSRFVKEIPEEFRESVKSNKSEGTGINFKLFGRSYFKKDKIQSNFKVKKSDIIFKVGDKVEHAKFGQGKILSVINVDNDQLLEVKFEGKTTKKLLANYANLNLLD